MFQTIRRVPYGVIAILSLVFLEGRMGAENQEDDYAVRKDRAMNEAITLLKTREKVLVSEVSSILAKHGMPSSEADSRKLIELWIGNNKIEGLLDETQFVSKYALNREQVRYDIVSKFEVGENGAVMLKCPSCGGSLPLQGKESSGVCKYCGTQYSVPRNILSIAAILLGQK